jgi:hypothetical protein
MIASSILKYYVVFLFYYIFGSQSRHKFVYTVYLVTIYLYYVHLSRIVEKQKLIIVCRRKFKTIQ